MTTRDPIGDARRSFAHNLQIAEEDLKMVRSSMRGAQNIRRHAHLAGWVHRAYVLFMYHLTDKRLMIQDARDVRARIRFYRKVEGDLSRSDLASAIEALSMFAPEQETLRGTARRVRRSPPTLGAVLNSPHILRMKMLRLRDELASIQGARAN